MAKKTTKKTPVILSPFQGYLGTHVKGIGEIAEAVVTQMARLVARGGDLNETVYRQVQNLIAVPVATLIVPESDEYNWGIIESELRKDDVSTLGVSKI